ncbi:MAG: BspA family leucine-rich repeat surface protein, partial [Allomuricauda sp.]
KIAIKGKFPQINMFGLFEQFRLKITSIDQWGAIEWKSFKQAFMGCFNLEYNAKDIPNLTQVSDLSYMFAEATIFNGDLSNWETGNVTTIAAMFRNATLFNGNIGGWDVQNVEIMSEVFSGAGKFDQNLGEWKIKSLLEGGSMFNFLNNSGLSPENYANTIIGWANQENVPSNITFGMDGMGHCDEEAYNAQVYLESEKGWTFVGEDNGC